MNKFVLSALALTTAGGVALAGSETKEWLSLDREIAGLNASTAQAASSGVALSGFIRTSYVNSSDLDGDGNPTDGTPSDSDLGGFALDNARINVSGSIGRFGAYIQVDGSTDAEEDATLTGSSVVDFLGTAGSVVVLDAYASWNITDEIQLRMGNFRTPFLSSALSDENQLLFLNRTVNGEFWDNRDLGVQINGAFNTLKWWVAGQNGLDGQGDELSYALRVALDLMGAGSQVEGAYGAGEGTNLTLAAAYRDDEVLDDGAAIAVEGHLALSAFALSAEAVDYDEDLGDITPWTVTASFLINNQWELAARYEDLDDSDDTTLMSLGVNWYLEGHNAKWQLNYLTGDSDNSNFEADVIALGLVVAI